MWIYKCEYFNSATFGFALLQGSGGNNIQIRDMLRARLMMLF